MKRYVVSYISFFDNELYSVIVYADNLLAATFLGLLEVTGTTSQDWPVEEVNTVESIKCEAFNCDAMVNAIEVD